LWSSLQDDHPLRRRGLAHRPCEAGASWQWDGVRFDVLHPEAGASARAASKPNALSCVIRVVDAHGRALMLTGDIEAPQELALLSSAAESRAESRTESRDDLRADALIVAHHGSRTSTTAAWLDAVQPRFAVVQAGYRNRFGHPAPDVSRRLESRGVHLLRSDQCGAWTWLGDDAFVCERDARRRYWHRP
jgi:competence protein ComEC